MQVILPNRATARLHRGLIAAAGALLLAVSVPATARPAPESFAELSEKVVPAVVNISTTQTLKREERQDALQPAPGSPEELFKDFFDRHRPDRSEEHTSELQSLMRISYAVFCLKKKN